MIERVEKSHSFIHQAISSTQRNVRHLAVLAIPACAFVLAPLITLILSDGIL